MARLPITIYRNSILASIISIVGTICLVAGVCLVFEETITGIVMAIFGGVFMLWAHCISENKAFRRWKKQLKTDGIIDMMPSSNDICMRVYYSNPCKKTIKFIGKYNSSVADELKSQMRRKKQF